MRCLVPFTIALLAAGCASESDFQERTQKDNWFQAANNEVDILWVVDNSCSMEEEQQTLAQGFQTFVAQMEASGTDFHIGVISTSVDYTSPDLGKLLGTPPYLTSSDDYVNGFIERATLGVDGSDKEKGLEAAARALHPSLTAPGGYNKGFLRPAAELLVVFVSDEEDCSDEGALGDQPAEECYRQDELLVPVSDYVKTFQNMKDSKDMVQVGAIVGVQNAACADAFPGSRYIQLSKFTGGLVGDICLADWSGLLLDLGLTATGIRTEFQTKFVAQPDSIQLFVDDVEMVDGSDYSYDQELCMLQFTPAAVPDRGAEIRAEYTIQSGSFCPQ